METRGHSVLPVRVKEINISEWFPTLPRLDKEVSFDMWLSLYSFV